MIKMNMKQAAEYLDKTFWPTCKIICIMEGPTNSDWHPCEESVSWDTCEEAHGTSKCPRKHS